MERASVAIKRTAKSHGTPVRKAVTSPGLRHVELRAAHLMSPGDRYIGWLCKNKACGLLMAIVSPESKSSAGSDDQLAALKCPHCGNEDLYRWGARAEHTYAAKGAGP
jgi:hypothetical protein